VLLRRSVKEVGGATRSRTGLNGFAIRSITALLSRQFENCSDNQHHPMTDFTALIRGYAPLPELFLPGSR
jgi:hypothetical protein